MFCLACNWFLLLLLLLLPLLRYNPTTTSTLPIAEQKTPLR
jgi:hypothetical protein